MYHQLKQSTGDTLRRENFRRRNRNTGWPNASRLHCYLGRCCWAYGERSVHALKFDEGLSLRTDETAHPVTANVSINKAATHEEQDKEIWGSKSSSLTENAYTDELWQGFSEGGAFLTRASARFLMAHFRARPKHLYSVSFPSRRLREDPGGSHLWNTNADPSIRINVLVKLSDIDIGDHPICTVPWQDCAQLFLGQTAAICRGLATAGAAINKTQPMLRANSQALEQDLWAPADEAA